MKIASVLPELNSMGFEAMTANLPDGQWRAGHQEANQKQSCFVNPAKTRLGIPDKEYIDIPQHLLSKEKLHPSKIQGEWYWMWTEPASPAH